MFPDRAALYVVAIEDRQYKDFKIHCKLLSLSLSLFLSLSVARFLTHTHTHTHTAPMLTNKHAYKHTHSLTGTSLGATVNSLSQQAFHTLSVRAMG